MAVYKRTYRAYAGSLTPSWSRFLILTRYAWRYLFRSRFMTGFFIACLVPTLVVALGLYLNHSESLLRLVRLPLGRTLIEDITKYFRGYLVMQMALATLLAAIAGPSLISPDLANNALPLYFCRPFSRAEYVLGKFCVIAWLVSAVTWIPGLILFGIEAGLSGGAWTWDHLWLANAMFSGSLLIVLLFSFLGLALSAWVKWKPIAGALVLGVFFLGAGFGAAINAVMRTTVGSYMDIGQMINRVWVSLFREAYDGPIPVWGALLQLAVVCGICVLMLKRKIRALEVIR